MTALVVFIIFIAVQFIASFGALLFSNLDKLGTNFPLDKLNVTPTATGLSMLVAEGLLALGLWLWFFRFERSVRNKAVTSPELLSIFKFNPLKRDIAEHRIGLWPMVSSVLGMLSLGILLSDVLNRFNITDQDAAFFTGMVHNPLCLLLLCVVGPLCEELVFRVGVLRSLYRHGVPGWAAAAISALAFAVVHGNLAQGIPAFVLGMVLGLAYLRTGNLRLCLPMHMANNILSVIFMATAEASTPTSSMAWWALICYLLIALNLLIPVLKPKG